MGTGDFKRLNFQFNAFYLLAVFSSFYTYANIFSAEFYVVLCEFCTTSTA